MFNRNVTAKDIRAKLDTDDISTEKKIDYMKHLINKGLFTELESALHKWNFDLKAGLDRIETKAHSCTTENDVLELRALRRAHEDSYGRLEEALSLSKYVLEKKRESAPRAATTLIRCYRRAEIS